jgi:hypothetical protein
MNPAIVQMDTQSKRFAFVPLWKDFPPERIHSMSKEVLGIETPPGGIISMT